MHLTHKPKSTPPVPLHHALPPRPQSLVPCHPSSHCLPPSVHVLFFSFFFFGPLFPPVFRVRPPKNKKGCPSKKKEHRNEKKHIHAQKHPARRHKTPFFGLVLLPASRRIGPMPKCAHRPSFHRFTAPDVPGSDPRHQVGRIFVGTRLVLVGAGACFSRIECDCTCKANALCATRSV